MSKGRVMIVGAVGSGKSTLIKALNGDQSAAAKTQAMGYTANSIDTPGEFMENPSYYRALFATSMEASAVMFIQDATRGPGRFFRRGLQRLFPNGPSGW